MSFLSRKPIDEGLDLTINVFRMKNEIYSQGEKWGVNTREDKGETDPQHFFVKKNYSLS
jgi:hypothetical protein